MLEKLNQKFWRVLIISDILWSNTPRSFTQKMLQGTISLLEFIALIRSDTDNYSLSELWKNKQIKYKPLALVTRIGDIILSAMLSLISTMQVFKLIANPLSSEPNQNQAADFFNLLKSQKIVFELVMLTQEQNFENILRNPRLLNHGEYQYNLYRLQGSKIVYSLLSYFSLVLLLSLNMLRCAMCGYSRPIQKAPTTQTQQNVPKKVSPLTKNKTPQHKEATDLIEMSAYSVAGSKPF